VPTLPAFTRRQFVIAGAAATLAPAITRAQSFPSRSIELIVSAPPGASVDFTGRLVQAKIGNSLGQPMVVENRTGAGGNIGSAYVAKSPPDGHRILLTTNAVMTVNPHVYKNMGFDVLKDLAPITLAVSGPIGIAVSATIDIKSMADLVAFAKKNPGKLSYATPGSGSPQHVVGELIKQRAGIFIVHIPYRGLGPAFIDVIAGTVQIVISTLSALLPHAAAGKLRILALAEAKRSEAAPELPVIAETIPGVEASAWLAFFAPGGTPRDIITRLNGALSAALKSDELRPKLIANALVPGGGTPEELERLVRVDYERWGRIVRERGIAAD
jgi:tripartite-type tricarboxylate transporter receptor subunit TctC